MARSSTGIEVERNARGLKFAHRRHSSEGDDKRVREVEVEIGENSKREGSG